MQQCFNPEGLHNTDSGITLTDTTGIDQRVRRCVQIIEVKDDVSSASSTVPDRSNPTGNALLERKWNAT